MRINNYVLVAIGAHLPAVYLKLGRTRQVRRWSSHTLLLCTDPLIMAHETVFLKSKPAVHPKSHRG
jgi:hypothetical protein